MIDMDCPHFRHGTFSQKYLLHIHEYILLPRGDIQVCRMTSNAPGLKYGRYAESRPRFLRFCHVAVLKTSHCMPIPGDPANSICT
jgi:hypothetical protein